jgi:hypothetical protein
MEESSMNVFALVSHSQVTDRRRRGDPFLVTIDLSAVEFT